jgi:sortase family protein
MLSQRRRWHAWPVVFLSMGLAAMLIAMSGLMTLHPTPQDFGSLRSTAGATLADRAVPPRSIAASSAPASSAGDRPVPARPVSIAIAALQVQAPTEQVRTTDGTLGVPDNPSHVGWWIGSALPGAASGTVVIDGHVDSAVAGPGALFHIADLRTGDQIAVTTERDQQVHYAVEARRVLSKDNPLPAEFFANTGPPRLVLISCGGPFDRQTLSYEDNIVVVARLVLGN